MNGKNIEPYIRERIVLCAGDASPVSQRKESCDAGHFFSGGKWVGAMRNAAERLKCRFVILAGPYGLVDPWEIISPYDMPGYTQEERAIIVEKCSSTIPRLIGGDQYDLVVLYAGANPRQMILDIIVPILKSNSLDLITFGKPNMYDIDKIDDVVEELIKGTSLNLLRDILKVPERLEFFSR